MEHKKRTFFILYLIMAISITGIVAWLALCYQGPDTIQACFSEPVPFDTGWRNETNEPVILNRLAESDSVTPYQQFSIYHTLPDTIAKDTAFCFRSKNIYYQVYIDGRLVYNPYVPESIFYPKSLGTRWNYITLSPEDAGRQLELRITTVYKSARTGLSNVYLGSPGSVILDTLQSKTVALITCILLLFVGLLLMFADIPINMQAKKNHELLYLGLFAVSIAIWCLTETNLLQLFWGDSRLISFISCSSLMLIPIPMVLYLDSAFGFRKNFVIPLISILSITGFAVCMVLHLLDIADIHETLNITHVVLGISALILLYTITKNSLIKGKNTAKNIYRILRGIGLSCISIATGIDIVRFYLGSTGDSAMFVRIGLLIFIICYGTSSLEKTINAVKLGIQTEFVSQLAYRDGLTGIGNRTAFQEHLVNLEKQKEELPSIGIIMFDVNDLKFVNDHMGHQAGDSLLIHSATLIRDAFQDLNCDCYRIGGDEFSILLSGEDVKQRCDLGLKQFRQLIAECNRTAELPFRISIAYGYALYDATSPEKKLMDTYQQADLNMYENKKWLKAHQTRMEDLYSETTTKLTK